ncbi:MAG: chorismate mutase [Bacteroidota bacterium]
MKKEAEITQPEDWFSGIKRPLIISGPCSAESEDQVMKTAVGLAGTGRVHIFRAGIWKPRTTPRAFKGVGSIGLDWLVKVKQQTGLHVATEVATPQHVEECLKCGIDVLWIGARTVSNPFSVQELAEALKGTDIPVLVKNPVNPDLGLWIGAFERLTRACVTKIAAIHRGFYPFERSPLRNIPKWEVPVELKSLWPDLPIICDPSHIAGSREAIAGISQKALDLNMDGLMIESHIHPEAALSDAQQQLNPTELDFLLKTLTFRTVAIDNKEFLNSLEQLRNQIDSIDSQIIELLGQRMEIVDRIGMFKKENNITILQIKRWNAIVAALTAQAEHNNLPIEFVRNFLQLIHQESIRRQTEIFKK